MARGKDLKKRKTTGYSNGVLSRGEEYKINLKLAVTNSRKNEKYIPENTNILSLDEVIIRINQLGKWTQGTNRKIYLDKELYKSILHYSKNFILNTDKLSEKIYGIIYSNSHSTCKSCKSQLRFGCIGSGYTRGCNNRECNQFLPTGFTSMKLKLGDKRYQEYLDNRIKPLGEEWFKIKYGKNEYKKFRDVYREKMKNVAILNLVKNSRSSIAACNFFDELFKLGYQGEYANNVGERCIRLPNNNALNKNCIFLDFVLGDKIIEYDGLYFHDAVSDRIRDEYLIKCGFKILRVPHEVAKYKNGMCGQINKCIQFLNDE